MNASLYVQTFYHSWKLLVVMKISSTLCRMFCNTVDCYAHGWWSV